VVFCCVFLLYFFFLLYFILACLYKSLLNSYIRSFLINEWHSKFLFVRLIDFFCISLTPSCLINLGAPISLFGLFCFFRWFVMHLSWQFPKHYVVTLGIRKTMLLLMLPLSQAFLLLFFSSVAFCGLRHLAFFLSLEGKKDRVRGGDLSSISPSEQGVAGGENGRQGSSKLSVIFFFFLIFFKKNVSL
jgi:hypothetical protein